MSRPVFVPSSAAAQRTMRANQPVSAVELRLRSAIWALGVRGYRVHPPLPGRPDVAFPAIRLAVFVHGCFWHRCPTCNPPYPKANRDLWREKLDGNVVRDADVVARLARLGWNTITVWEHDVRRDPRAAAIYVRNEVAVRRAMRQGRTVDHPQRSTMDEG